MGGPSETRTSVDLSVTFGPYVTAELAGWAVFIEGTAVIVVDDPREASAWAALILDCPAVAVSP
jgi:hypothetical protein